MSVDLEVQLEEIEGKAILRISGRLDAASSPVLEKKINQLMGDGRSVLLMDFSQVEYLSSAGMRLLLSVTKKLKEKDGHLVIFSIGEEAMEIIKMAGFEHILNICSTEQKALQFS